MDNKRLFFAIVLSLLVLVLWQILFVKKGPEPQPPFEDQVQVEKAPSGVLSRESILPSEKPSAEKEAAKPKSIPEPTGQVIEQKISVDTSLYHAVWSNRGGVLQSWKLKTHKDEQGNDLELVSLRAAELNIFPLSVWTDDQAFNDEVNRANYKVSREKLELKDGNSGELRFEYSDGKGNSVEKILVFHDGKYDFDVETSVIRNGGKIEPRILWGPDFSNPSEVQIKQRFSRSRGMAALAAGRVYRIDEMKYKPEESLLNYAQWGAYEDTYFTALFITPPLKNNIEFILEAKENEHHFFLLVNSPQKAYIGPKDVDFLTRFGYEAKKIIRFGLFGFIAEILLKGMKLSYKVIPNWGIAIIILTLITKVIFFPLTYSSTRSMAKMQEIQPKIKALRAKHKKAKQDIAQRRQMNEEMMRLYKEHGINPAGGCLPILIQLPVFWGFFQILRVAIEFRQSPFLFWIRDLSAKDPYYITPILMGITQYISQKMTPTSADPTQQKMMLIMPFFFTFIFASFPSGLVLYWLTQNVLQIAQQYIINRLTKKKKGETHGKRKRR